MGERSELPSLQGRDSRASAASSEPDRACGLAVTPLLVGEGSGALMGRYFGGPSAQRPSEVYLLLPATVHTNAQSVALV